MCFLLFRFVASRSMEALEFCIKDLQFSGQKQ